ncbi:hypothetical protein OsJ_18853 [Oryza sativa Japonica Group]|uniref:Uncharacterized protein n=1 Tax=Oryza sativa subsp. japonica TaxID=39947 RepID=B9FKN4_ORYSJ|nr:hypothetical protein OsJ_18853 [Oryza sativa Japonica Group]
MVDEPSGSGFDGGGGDGGGCGQAAVSNSGGIDDAPPRRSPRPPLPLRPLPHLRAAARRISGTPTTTRRTTIPIRLTTTPRITPTRLTTRIRRITPTRLTTRIRRTITPTLTPIPPRRPYRWANVDGAGYGTTVELQFCASCSYK